MQKINFIDRTPGNVAGNGAIRYGIYNSDGSLRGYAYITKEDEATIKGTKINKVLFDKIDANLEIINGKAEISNKSWTLSSELGSKVNTKDIIPTTNWTETSTAGEFTNGDFKIYGSNYDRDTMKINKAFDGNESSFYLGDMQTGSSSSAVGFYIDLGKAITINKFKSYVNGTYIKLYASNTAPESSQNGIITWKRNSASVIYEYEMNAYGGTEHYTDTTEIITIDNPQQYRYFGVIATTDGEEETISARIFGIAEWIEQCYITEFDFNIGEIEEGTTMIIKTSATGYRNLLRFNDKDIFITNILDAHKYFELIYNGETFDATEIA